MFANSWIYQCAKTCHPLAFAELSLPVTDAILESQSVFCFTLNKRDDNCHLNVTRDVGLAQSDRTK